MSESESDFIREIFARIEREPETSREALRARIVRSLRGEVPEATPFHGDRGVPMTLEELAERGRSKIAARRQKEADQRYERWQSLRKFIAGDLEPELRPHVGRVVEPANGTEYVLRLEIAGFAPILASYFFVAGQWSRLRWLKGLWAIEPRPDAPFGRWLGADDLDEALAIARDCYPAHLIAPEGPQAFGWCDWVTRTLGIS